MFCGLANVTFAHLSGLVTHFIERHVFWKLWNRWIEMLIQCIAVLLIDSAILVAVAAV